MQIGDTVYLHTSQSLPGTIHPGRVVYIHPKRRFYVAERAGAPDYTATAMTEAERKQRDRLAHRKKKRK